MTPALPPVIVTVNLKGGVGKTTLAANIATEAARSHKVLAVDLDTQASLLAWHSTAAEAGGSPVPVVQLNGASLRTTLPQVAQGFDLVVIDTPPRIEEGVLAALAICTVALVPMTPGPMELWALEPTLAALRLTASWRDFRAIVVVNRGDRTSVTASCHEALRAAGLTVADATVRNTVAFPVAMAAGQGVTVHDPKSDAAFDIRRLTREALSGRGGEA